MDTSNIKRFATQARTILKQGVINKFAMLGFDADGNVKPENEPMPVQGGVLFKGQVIDDPAFYSRWQSLRHRVGVRGIRDVYEEAAYTWFNRFMAISILQHNGLMAPALQFESDDVRIPLVVGNARRGLLPTMTDADRTRLNAIINDDTQTTPQFAILVTALCQFTPILKACFGGITDYTALLLPDDILAKDGFIDQLNHTPFITDDDYRQSELIGWLYQFYISERKDEVFASFKSGHKAEAEDIPAATQIFTPNWIVKYMVQNTLGRIYLDNNPDSDLKDQWQYLVDSPSERGQGGVLKLSSLEDYSFADLSCGSGHILVEAFDLLYSLYQQEFYSRRDAITAIFTHNLTGVDIDTRARQLASFALLLKACQLDNSFSNAQVLPNVLDMPEPYTATDLQAVVTDYLVDADTTTIMQVVDAVELMKQAYNLGSIMKFELSDESRAVIQSCTDQWLKQTVIPAEIQNMMHYMRILLALTDKYAAVVMNPPYMGNGNMNDVLSKYVKQNYEIGKADLCTTFMLLQAERTLEGGYYANIVPPSWLFLSTFQPLRNNIIDNQSIHSMLYLSRGVFGADFGSVSTVIQNRKDLNACGTYFRLVERTFQEFDQRHLKLLFEKTLDNHDFRFKFIDYSKDVTDIVYSSDGARIYYPSVPQSNYKKIPGSPIAFYVSEKTIKAFEGEKVKDHFPAGHGILSGNNDAMFREWWTIDYDLIGFGFKSTENFQKSKYKYAPTSKGGEFRRWFGSYNIVAKFDKASLEYMKQFPKFTLQNSSNYFKSGITWGSIMSSNDLSARYLPEGYLFNHSTPSAFPIDVPYQSATAFLCSKVCSLLYSLINPSISCNAGDINKIPVVNIELWDSEISKDCIAISKADWDAHETSMDFQENELIRMQHRCINHAIHQVLMPIDPNILENDEELKGIGRNPGLIKDCLQCYVNKWMRLHMRLHSNEEELNRQFIEIYGLQKELSPRVELDEVTILQHGEVTIPESAKNDIHPYLHSEYFNEDNIIQQLISYAVGCYMGRYRLDRPGLHIAHPNATPEEKAPYQVPEFPYPELTQDLIDEHVLAVYDDYSEITDDIRIPLDSTLANRYESTKARKYESTKAIFEIDDDGIIPILPRDCGSPDNLLRCVTNFIELVFGPQNLVANLNFIEATLGKSLEDYLIKDFWKDHVKRYQKRPIYWLFSSKKGAFKAIAYMHRMDAFTVSTVRNHYLLPYINHLEERIAPLQMRQAELTSAERRTLERLIKDLDDCREYDLRLHQVADQQIAFDLDDGVLVNYAKFGDVLSKL